VDFCVIGCAPKVDGEELTYLLTPWSKVLLEKLTSLRSYPRNSLHFMEPEGSLPNSKVPATDGEEHHPKTYKDKSYIF
jgi:hypothetical protein